MKKKLEYYEKHCALLEKENEDLKQQIIDNEIGLSIVKENASESYDNLSILIKKAKTAKTLIRSLYFIHNKFFYWFKIWSSQWNKCNT